jgi:O-antigen/teichoic acid export membrane protein
LWLALAVLVVAAYTCWPLAWATRGSRAGMEGRFGFGPESNWLALYYVVGSGLAYVNVFLVAALLDDTAVASFGAALRYYAIVLGPMPALLAVLRVRTSQHDVVDSDEVQTEMLMRWLKQAALPVLAAFAIAAIAAPFAIPLIDEGRYPDSIPIFQLLLIGGFVIYATMPGPNLLMAQRRFRLLAIAFGTALVADIVVALVAGTVWGVVGIAAAAGVSTGALHATVAYLSVRRQAGARERPQAARTVG